MKNYILTTSILGILLCSCKKEETKQNLPNSEPSNQFVTTTGSYWIYNWYKIDTNGVETQYNYKDTISIIGDSVVSGKTYAVFKDSYLGLDHGIKLRRDSLGFIVEPGGKIIYSYTHFDQILDSGTEPGLWDWNKKMDNSTDHIIVPAGGFHCYKLIHYLYDDAGNPISNCGDLSRTFNTWYKNGVGEIKHQTSYMSHIVNCDYYMERRLVEYHIEP